MSKSMKFYSRKQKNSDSEEFDLDNEASDYCEQGNLADGELYQEEKECSGDSAELNLFCGRNGHTMRKYPYVYSYEKEVAIERSGANVRIDPDSSATEIPITEIDSWFDKGFYEVPKCQYNRYCGKENVRKKFRIVF